MTATGFFQFRHSVWTLAGLLIAGCALSPAPTRGAAKAEASAAALIADSGKAAPQDGPIRGPLLGYVFDPASSGIRPLPGIPGASYVGNAMPIGFTSSLVEVSPSQNYALGVEAGTGYLFVIDLRLGIPAAERLTAVNAGVDRIFFSPSGQAAALYDRQARQVEILTGLPETSANQGRIDLTGMPGMLTALAVSDDGKVLAAASSQATGSRSESGTLFVSSPGENLHPVGPLGRASALSFLNDSQDLLVADIGRNEVVRVRNPRTGAEWTVLASRQDGLDQPVAVAASRDNSTAFAVSAADNKIAWIPLSGGAVEFVDCPCKPTGLNALTSGSVFRITSASSAPLFMLDARPGDGLANPPRVLFIPAPDAAPERRDDASASPRGRVRR
jgi:sugar lactone lactonase YvrE